MLTPYQIAQEQMLANDTMSQWLGIEMIEIAKGRCKLRMQVRSDMLNGFKIGHGGITYSFADSALAFASNSHGPKAVSIETSISHVKPVLENDLLYAEAAELSRNHKIGVYQVEVINQNEEVVALFKGTVYIKKETWV